MPTPPRTFLVGFKWVFVQKRNKNNEVIRYKARLVVQGFTQRPGVDFNETYSLVMNIITFRYLISLAIKTSIFAVNGYHDCIFIQAIRFRYIHESP
jgi:hypothetical protein